MAYCLAAVSTVLFIYFTSNSSIVNQLWYKIFDINTKDKIGQTALHIAVLENQPQKVKMLVKNGININSQDNILGLSALHISCELGHT